MIYIKTCVTHGKLTQEQTIKSGKSGPRCKECYKEIRRNNYIKNKSHIYNKNKTCWKEEKWDADSQMKMIE